MHRSLAALASGLLGAVLLAGPATADDVDDCVQGADAALQRSACTAVIDARRDSGEDLSWAYYNRALAAYSLGEYEPAIRDLDAAIAIGPDYGNAFGLRCSANFRLGNNEAALDDCNQDIALRPQNSTSFYNRGLVHCALGDGDAAAADMAAQWELAPDEVAVDQRMLETRGFYDGPIDGVVTDATLQALTDWAEAGC